MDSGSRWSTIRRGIRNRGREIALIVALLLINFLIFSRLVLMVSGSRQPTPTPTRTAKPTFTPFNVVVATPTSPAEPTPTTEPSPAPSTHVVQQGETLSEIARDYGVTVDAIVEANNLGDADAIIREGQELVIPVLPASVPEAEGTGVPASTPSSTVGQRVHVVQEGETLSEIAKMYGVTSDALAQANGLDNPNAIRAGQALVIP